MYENLRPATKRNWMLGGDGTWTTGESFQSLEYLYSQVSQVSQVPQSQNLKISYLKSSLSWNSYVWDFATCNKWNTRWWLHVNKGGSFQSLKCSHSQSLSTLSTLSVLKSQNLIISKAHCLETAMYEMWDFAMCNKTQCAREEGAWAEVNRGGFDFRQMVVDMTEGTYLTLFSLLYSIFPRTHELYRSTARDSDGANRLVISHG